MALKRERETIPNALSKLQEAEVALTKMKRTEAYDAPIARREDFLPYLKQFLGACYSVTLALDKSKKGWRQHLDSDETELNNFMVDQRCTEVHNEGAVGLRQEVKFYPAHRFKEVTIVPPPALFASGPPDPPSVGLTQYYFETRKGRQEIIPTCERYLSLLAKMI